MDSEGMHNSQCGRGQEFTDVETIFRRKYSGSRTTGGFLEKIAHGMLMKKIAFSICCLAFSAPALANTRDIVASNNEVGIQYLLTNVDYTETGNGIFGTKTGILDTETGPVHGFAFSVSAMRGPGNDYVHAEMDYASGYTTYTGSLLVGGGPFGSVVATSSATLADYSARFGKGFAIRDQFMLTPFAEIGRHQWDRGVNYGEIYTHYYYGVGLLGQYSPFGKVVLSADALLGRTTSSQITVNSGPGIGGFAGSLGNSVLSRLGVAADYAFTRQFHGTAAFDYTSFSYGMSAVFPAGGGFVTWEPDSKTYYARVKLGVAVAF